MKTCALIAVCISSKAWQDDESIRNFPKSSNRQEENMKVFSSGLLDSVLGTLAIHRPQGTPVVLGVLMVNIQKTAGAKRQHS